MPETVSVPLADLLLDQKNARLGDEQASQQQVYVTLAKQQAKRLVNLAENIVKHGTDPTNLPAVVATDDQRRKYRVIEGNRRVLALKALDNPMIVSGGLSPSEQRRLGELAKLFEKDPVDELTCVLFDNEDDAFHWVTLRHTGANEGAGLVEWDANEQDRFLSRHGQNRPRSTAGQILDYVDSVDGPSSSKTRIMTTLQRILNTKEIRETLGIDFVGGQVVTHFPAAEVIKGLRRMVTDLRSGTIKVKDVYEASDRVAYLKEFSASELPDPATRIASPVILADAGKASSSGVPPLKPKPRPKTRTKAPRTSVAMKNCGINPAPPRLNGIFNELTSLDADTFPNAGVVMLRVFLELTVDHGIAEYSLMTEQERMNTPLSKRLKKVVDKLHSEDLLDQQLKRAMYKIADSQDTIAASAMTFNQYVHNKYVIPKASEVRTAWDELQPFLQVVWQ
ncbi:hypothetical protein [Arthrobacter sp. B3I4]|uniref:hypothetical protein n=1 Tax=Arthrobacter sp. B3I4 TaxID=3042267 RepID=UPI002784AA75|nr:hypothetical protein [Arthrobacter sp. B3I4]MDQ0755056.1 hypothetical protein [Arthrobacter sp. B3I4]